MFSGVVRADSAARSSAIISAKTFVGWPRPSRDGSGNDTARGIGKLIRSGNKMVDKTLLESRGRLHGLAVKYKLQRQLCPGPFEGARGTAIARKKAEIDFRKPQLA